MSFYMRGCKTSLMHDGFDVISCQFLPTVSTSTYERGAELNISCLKKCSYFCLKLIRQHIFKPKFLVNAIVERRVCKKKNL